jgi:hypothetical protein
VTSAAERAVEETAGLFEKLARGARLKVAGEGQSACRTMPAA